MITSTHNAKVQLIRTLLNEKKARDENSLFIAEGVRLIEEGLQSNWKIKELLYSSRLGQRGRNIIDRYQASSITAEEVKPELFESLSATDNSQGILAVFEKKYYEFPDDQDFLVIADQIRDPGNLGTLMRTAWAGGVQMMLLTAGCVDPYSPKVIRSAMGAHFHLPFQQTTVADIQIWRNTAGSKILFYAAAMEQGTSCWETDLRVPLALILGSEAEGITPQMLALVDKSIHLPMPGGSESLNAAIAGSILIFEIVRQRKK